MGTGSVDIDPIQYGILWQRVQDMDERQKKMEKQVDQLVELANRSKGGLWLGMTIVATLSAVAGFIGAYFKSH